VKKSGSNISSLYVPEPPFRPGDTPDYSHISVPAAHTPPRPDPLCEANATRDHATALIRVMRFNGETHGDWAPKISADKLRKALPDMIFPTYRQQGILINRGASMKDMMCQCLSNSGDPLDGKSIPLMIHLSIDRKMNRMSGPLVIL